jgi:hypothetical protein
VNDDTHLESCDEDDDSDAEIISIHPNHIVDWRETEAHEPAQQQNLGGFSDPHKERGVISSLYETTLNSYLALLKQIGTNDRSILSASGNIPDARPATSAGPVPVKAATCAQIATLKEGFIRLNVWGKDFDVANSALDKRLEHSEGIKEDVVLLLLQLCDTTHQGSFFSPIYLLLIQALTNNSAPPHR